VSVECGCISYLFGVSSPPSFPTRVLIPHAAKQMRICNLTINIDQVTYKTRLDPKAELTIEEAVATVKDAFVTCGEVNKWLVCSCLCF